MLFSNGWFCITTQLFIKISFRPRTAGWYVVKKKKSYIKDSTDFINFVERTKVHQDTILVSMDVASLYTNIPQEEGITTVCRAYDTFHNNNPPIPTKYLREMLDLILKENSFQFNGENYLQTHGTAMGILKWQLLLQTSSWQNLKQNSSAKAESSQ